MRRAPAGMGQDDPERTMTSGDKLWGTTEDQEVTDALVGETVLIIHGLKKGAGMFGSKKTSRRQNLFE